MARKPEAPSYSTWIRKRRIALFWTITAVVGAGSALGILHPALYLVGLAALPFAWIAMVITLAARRFSPAGGDFQRKIHQLIAGAVPGDGSVLDVGCGSGALLIMFAGRNPHRACVGVDTWADDWEYSIRQCEANARSEGVANAEFRRASASSLPFENASFSNVVSCLTFHEVRNAGPALNAVLEAVRVLAPGGHFAFFDLFHDPAHYPSIGEVVATIRGAGCEVDRNERLSDLLELPFPLNTAKVLKYAALIAGRRT